MNYILLSGGSGKRLWPLSNSVRSKQFIKLFENEQGEPESMIQRVYRQIRKADPEAKIVIATSKSQVSMIHNQLGEVDISIEPARRDTFPAIALAVAYVTDVLKVSKDEPVVVCPVDPYVQDSYFECLKQVGVLASKRAEGGLVLMGIHPTYPSEKYGYIIPKDAEPITKAIRFAEKPNLETAKEYLELNALWNGGVFGFKLGYLLSKMDELLGVNNYDELYAGYESLKAISFDYAFVEKEKDITVIRYNGEWKDIGTWNTLSESLDKKVIGKGVLDKNSSNVNIINELDLPILALGLNDVVISASPDGILVADKHESSYMKPYVDSLEETAMYAEKSWGSYQIINVEKGSLTLKVTLNPGHKMHYHSHQKRDEVWILIEGEGMTLIDGMVQDVHAGDVITMQAGCKHMISAKNKMKLIEVQVGEGISVKDKTRYD